MSHNDELKLGIPGPRFWQREMWDRYIRDWTHLTKVVSYIHENPVKARLCRTPEDWPWSSAAIASASSIAEKNLGAPGKDVSAAPAGNAKFPLGE